MEKKLKVSLVRSLIGRPKKHRKILKNMKLTKINRTINFYDISSVRGMLNKVSHLVKIEENV